MSVKATHLSLVRLSHVKKTEEPRNETPKPRSIILPVYLWDALDRDAKRCRRSAIKQIEAILVRYYGLDSNIELDEQRLTEVAEAVSDTRRKVA